jgi:hypothetical protein
MKQNCEFRVLSIMKTNSTKRRGSFRAEKRNSEKTHTSYRVQKTGVGRSGAVTQTSHECPSLRAHKETHTHESFRVQKAARGSCTVTQMNRGDILCGFFRQTRCDPTPKAKAEWYLEATTVPTSKLIPPPQINMPIVLS